jgi:hypothetical protein
MDRRASAMGTLIDESEEVDLEAEWADKIAKSSLSPKRRKICERKLMMRRRIEEIEEKRRLKSLIEDYDQSYSDYF